MKHSLRMLSCVLFLYGHPLATWAADDVNPHTDSEGWFGNLLQKLGASDKVDLSHGIDWGVLPGPFYNPDMGLGLGIAAVGLYKPSNTQEATQLSTLTIRGLISSTGAAGVNFDNSTFFGNDDWRLFVSGSVMHVPTYYWGIGIQQAESNNNKEKYTKQEFVLAPKLMRRVAPNTYLGLGWNLQNTQASSLENGKQSKIEQDQAGANVLSSGATVSFSYDTRDFIPNPSKGQNLQADATFFGKGIGSQYNFQILESQYNAYQKVFTQDIIALDIYGRFGWGDVPWNMLSQMGGNKRMRGYLQGQYRDKNLLEAQVEYRHHLVGRHGIVVWAGTGSVADTPAGLTRNQWLPNGGIGYRFEFKPRINIRLDLGFGKDTTGMYFQLNEAF